MTTPPRNSRRHWDRVAVIAVAVGLVFIVVVVALATTRVSLADHESTTMMDFAAVAESSSPGASGNGQIDFRGGMESDTRWTATFQFRGLQPSTTYTVVVQGRYGDDDSPEASEFSQVCSLTTSESGTGGCWYYFVGLRRLGVVQVRLGDANGPVVLQATKAEDGPGSMSRTPNEFSLAPTATPSRDPIATPAT